jgi:hypothetical protein
MSDIPAKTLSMTFSCPMCTEKADRIAEMEAQLDGLVSWFMGHGFSAQEVRKWVDEQRGD